MARLISIFVILISMFICPDVRADDFAKLSYENMVKTLIRYGALDIKKDETIDEYSVLTECKLYEYFYKDDFRWQEFRQAMRTKIDQEVKTFPTGYKYDTIVNLDRYNFSEKLYRFTTQTAIDGVVSFVVEAKDGGTPGCGSMERVKLPTSYRIVMDNPIYISGLPFGEIEAKKLLSRLQEAGNNGRAIFVRFNFRITYVAPVVKNETNYAQQKEGGKFSSEIRLDAKLNSINFYEDPERTKLLYVYRQ